MNAFLRTIISLRLTVILLGLGMILVFFGTLDQVHTGIWETQRRYFESFFVVWKYPEQWPWSESLYFLRIPMPGGYLIGFALLINLVAAHLYRFSLSWKKLGINLVHFGLILLLVSELLTDVLAVESRMMIPEGGTTYYTEDFRKNELVLIDRSDPELDTVHSISTNALKSGKPISGPELPVVIHPIRFFPNSAIARRQNATGFPESPANQGIGANRGTPDDLLIARQPIQYDEETINTVSAFVRLESPEGENFGIWLVSNVLDDRFPAQTFSVGDKIYELDLRFKRYYHNFGLELIDFRFDRYPGTEIPKNFSSEVNIIDPREDSLRSALIYMNHPLRYSGLTFFQASFDEETERATILQVVRNPGWLLPYFSVLLMGAGMSYQFLFHLLRFNRKRKSKTSA